MQTTIERSGRFPRNCFTYSRTFVATDSVQKCSFDNGTVFTLFPLQKNKGVVRELVSRSFTFGGILKKEKEKVKL